MNRLSTDCAFPRQMPGSSDEVAEEILAMPFVRGPDGVKFKADKPAKLRFFLGHVNDFAPTPEDYQEASDKYPFHTQMI